MAAYNIWDHVQGADETPATEYHYLNKYIDFSDFVYDHTYREQEVSILNPQMEAIGLKHIQWMAGETDCFGPLTRVCRALNKNNEVMWFVYG
jgi:hypothetical protein